MVKPQLGDRALFPKLEGVAYLAHAAISPLSAPVCERIREVTEDYACGGMAGFVRWAPRLAQVRHDLASLISASPSEIAIVANTTQGVIDVAFGLPWRKGDRVVLFDGEFPANVTPWQQAAEEFGLELCWLSLDGFHRSVDEGLGLARTGPPAGGPPRCGERRSIQDGASDAARRDGGALPQIRRGDFRRRDSSARGNAGRCVLGNRLPELR